MSTEPTTNAGEQDPFAEITAREATKLLGLALSGEHRPIDEVIDRLHVEGESWLSSVLETGPAAAYPQAVTSLPGGTMSIEQLQSIKETSKSVLAGSLAEGQRAAAVLTYFLAIATALAQHGRLITGHTRVEIDEILSDLAAVTPRPWTELLTRAIAAE